MRVRYGRCTPRILLPFPTHRKRGGGGSCSGGGEYADGPSARPRITASAPGRTAKLPKTTLFTETTGAVSTSRATRGN
ncbi:hypothetical protein E2C01_027996 [Portunus trituberculatus]|uniref:Uncharacterized protein n=1 Tax=Portunus trituberculatus TaxID=210409 RepID=A0A5B7EJI9_PORTR|nr:hypothetical protein [Portunus trituberculatus]